MVVETWLTNDKDRSFELNGYKSHSLYRSNQVGGGIKLHYLDYISVNIIYEFTGIGESCESISCIANISGYGKVNIVCIYRPPGKNFEIFIDYLNSVLENLDEEQTIVTGDINIDVLSTNEHKTIRYIETMSSFGFVTEINIPTYVSPISGEEKSCLDHIWHNLRSNCNSSVVRPAISDHFAVSIFFLT